MCSSNIVNNLKDFVGKNKGLILIILLSLFVRTIFFYQAKPWEKEIVENKILVFDAAGYHSQAMDILSAGARNC